VNPESFHILPEGPEELVVGIDWNTREMGVHLMLLILLENALQFLQDAVLVAVVGRSSSRLVQIGAKKPRPRSSEPTA
jgi:hypothetical protein